MNRNILKSYFQQILPMPEEIAAQFSEILTFKEIEKGETILQEGKINNLTHFIEEGFVRSFVIDVDDNEVTTELYGPSEFADNFLSFFRKTPSPETFQAITPCKVWVMDYETVQKHFHDFPEFREWGRLLLLSNFAKLQNRTINLLKLTAENRYEKLIRQKPELIQNVPLKYLASYLGITDTSLSRIRKDFARK
ncbi:Crp/Fnr family transcriptional regulator [Lacihabitans soyangensis]|uniref:Crp/Fnr family transcriptional regulator n=1 Tax=Lacihabitans soyangensis TaxID=869394 RepID=A0AAE3H5S0_9BACT|nr:Crp/Fnr family transcriptional regulator [Lacihabitans soyangensis]MCP9765407.1 Crp/Fnr family transcriptional regulator [Lacihabitans soyangensis]